MGINENRIWETLNIFSFPRLSGTKYEKKAFDLAIQKIKKLNVPYELQPFKFSTFYSRIYPKIAFPVAFWVVLTLYLNLNGLFVSLSLFLTFIFFFPLFILTRKPENIRIGKVLDSQNLFVKLNGYLTDVTGTKKEEDQVKKNFFIAHMDSKGQKFTARVRFLSIFSWTMSLIVIIIIILLKNIFLPQFSILFYFIGLFPLTINLVATSILSLNITNNHSKGVVDNASGLACLFELLNHYSNISNRDKLKNLILWFVFTGAEETGTMGIRYFYKLVKKVNPKQSIVNNFESLGKSVAIFIGKNNIANNPSYLEFFENLAKKKNFRTYISRITRGVHTDGIYMFRKNFNLFEFGSTEVGQYMHSKYDSLDNVNVSQLKKLCEFIIEVVNFFED